MSEATVPTGALTGGRLTTRLSSDERLARRAVAGDQRAFAAIFRRYHQDLYRYCLAILGSSDDAQDALQNTMVKALRSLPGESRPLELKPWLYRVAHNEAIDLIRSRRTADPLDVEQVVAGPDLAREAETRERLAHLIADLEALPERQRGALVMRELSGLGFDQIGAALGTSDAVARQTVYEARLGLRQIEAGREMSCDEITRALSDNDGRVLRRRDIRAHLRGCAECRAFREEIGGRRHDLAALSPLPALVATGLLQGIVGGGGGGLGAGLAGGAVKGLASSAAVKATATFAVVAAIGGAAADQAHLVDLGVPGGAGSPAPRSQGSADDATTAGSESASADTGSAAAVGAGHTAARPRVAGASPLAAERDAAAATPVTDEKGKTGALPETSAKGQQSAAAAAEKAHGSTRAQQARGVHGPKASHPTHPAHPTKPAHPAHPPKPSASSQPAKQGGKGQGATATGSEKAPPGHAKGQTAPTEATPEAQQAEPAPGAGNSEP